MLVVDSTYTVRIVGISLLTGHREGEVDGANSGNETLGLASGFTFPRIALSCGLSFAAPVSQTGHSQQLPHPRFTLYVCGTVFDHEM